MLKISHQDKRSLVRTETSTSDAHHHSACQSEGADWTMAQTKRRSLRSLIAIPSPHDKRLSNESYNHSQKLFRKCFAEHEHTPSCTKHTAILTPIARTTEHSGRPVQGQFPSTSIPRRQRSQDKRRCRHTQIANYYSRPYATHNQTSLLSRSRKQSAASLSPILIRREPEQRNLEI